jgi:hypothetical protein
MRVQSANRRMQGSSSADGRGNSDAAAGEAAAVPCGAGFLAQRTIGRPLGQGARITLESAGRRRCLRWFGERRSCGRRRRGAFGRPRPFGSHHLAGSPWRRAGRMKFREHRIGIDRHGPCAEKITGDTDNPDGNGNRQESVHRVTDRETAIGRGYGDGAGCSAAGPDGCPGIDTRRRRFELNQSGWRRRLESIPGIRGAAGQAQSCCGNYDETTHGPSVTLVRLTATFPAPTIGASAQPRNRAGLIR